MEVAYRQRLGKVEALAAQPVEARRPKLLSDLLPVCAGDEGAAMPPAAGGR